MRPVTLFTGQWADLDIETMCQKAVEFGYDFNQPLDPGVFPEGVPGSAQRARHQRTDQL